MSLKDSVFTAMSNGVHSHTMSRVWARKILRSKMALMTATSYSTSWKYAM